MDKQDIAAVLEHYDVGALQASVPFDCFPERPWMISVDAGDFAIRECFLSRHREGLRFEHRLASWLAAHDFPASQPVSTHAGGTWCERDGRLFAVYTLMPGEHFQPANAAQARSAGRGLAWFHGIASTLPGAKNRRLPEGHRTTVDDASFLRYQLGEREEIISLVRAFGELDGALPPSLPEALLFNDFHPGNVLFTDGGFSGAFDLDLCAWGVRLFDVALSLLAFTLSLEGEPDVPASAVFDMNCARSWLAGYSERGHLTTEEIGLIPLVLRRQARAGAVFDLTDVVKQSRQWVQHEWDLSQSQVALVDANCHAVIEEHSKPYATGPAAWQAP